jgi:hypothetical protein
VGEEVSGAWSAALLGATAAHAGFQATVTLLVYPALARVPARDWASAHALHSRRITPLVAVVYGALLVASGGAAWSLPSSVGVWAAVLAVVSTFAVTAFWAAPTHGRLAAGRDDRLVDRLLRVDRLRLAFALVALCAAVLGAP